MALNEAAGSHPSSRLVSFCVQASCSGLVLSIRSALSLAFSSGIPVRTFLLRLVGDASLLELPVSFSALLRLAPSFLHGPEGRCCRRFHTGLSVRLPLRLSPVSAGVRSGRAPVCLADLLFRLHSASLCLRDRSLFPGSRCLPCYGHSKSVRPLRRAHRLFLFMRFRLVAS